MRPKNLLSVLWLICLTVLLCLCTDAQAADFELTPVLGYRTTSLEVSTGIGCIAVVGAPCPDRAEADDDLTLGLILGAQISPAWYFEVLLNRREAPLGMDPIICPECNTVELTLDDLETTTLQIGVQRRWQTAKIQPFVALGLGISQWTTRSLSFFEVDIDDEQPSASLAGGLMAPLNDLLALRVEARAYWFDLPDDAFLFDQDTTETELSAGLAFRW